VPGAVRKYGRQQFRCRFPNSHYGDPRGGRPTALERNVLRYRAAEAALYLFYAEQVRQFMLNSVYREAVRDSNASPWQTGPERELETVVGRIVADAQLKGDLAASDAARILRVQMNNRHSTKKVRIALKYAVDAGILTAAEADELKGLLDYRNDIAHDIHLVMADISRSNAAVEYASFRPPAYKSNALDRLRVFKELLPERARGLIQVLSMDGLLFEHAELTYEQELRRLDRLIRKQIRCEEARIAAINAELDLSGTELVGDLHPRHPSNQRSDHVYGDDTYPSNHHLTRRGVEICYRLFDLGKSPLAVSYLMGISLRTAHARQKGWEKRGGARRTKVEIGSDHPAKATDCGRAWQSRGKPT
jgi:hypothetical protein